MVLMTVEMLLGILVWKMMEVHPMVVASQGKVPCIRGNVVVEALVLLAVPFLEGAGRTPRLVRMEVDPWDLLEVP